MENGNLNPSDENITFLVTTADKVRVDSQFRKITLLERAQLPQPIRIQFGESKEEFFATELATVQLRQLILKKCLLVANLSLRIISISQFCSEDDYEVILTKHGGIFRMENNQEVRFRRKEEYKATTPGDVIHTDMVHTGNGYSSNFTDESSKFFTPDPTPTKDHLKQSRMA